MVERRLAAIMVVDVVAYSRLMGADEVGTLAALNAHRQELIDLTIAAHHGRLVKTTGDGMLLEFGSVVDAIGCAVAIQRGMLSRNAQVPEIKRIIFRIGVNIGDIIIDGNDIFGDGVNVAARLESLCEPGGVCISRAANEQVRDELSLSFADLRRTYRKEHCAGSWRIWPQGCRHRFSPRNSAGASTTGTRARGPALTQPNDHFYCRMHRSIARHRGWRKLVAHTWRSHGIRTEL